MLFSCHFVSVAAAESSLLSKFLEMILGRLEVFLQKFDIVLDQFLFFLRAWRRRPPWRGPVQSGRGNGPIPVAFPERQ